MPQIFLLAKFTPDKNQVEKQEFTACHTITPIVNERTIEEATEIVLEEIHAAVGPTTGSIAYQMAALGTTAPPGCYIWGGIFEKADSHQLMREAIKVSGRAAYEDRVSA